MGEGTWGLETVKNAQKRRPARQDAYLRLHTQPTLFLALVYA